MGNCLSESHGDFDPTKPKCKEFYCDLCNPEQWNDRSELTCSMCTVVTTIPLLKVKVVTCNDCPKLEYIPSLERVVDLYCQKNKMLTFLPNMPCLGKLICSKCPLLSEFDKKLGSKLNTLSCADCPMLYLKLELFVRCNGKDGFSWGSYEKRPRNGLNKRFITAFKFCKKVYATLFQSRVFNEIGLQDITLAAKDFKNSESFTRKRQSEIGLLVV